MISERTGLVPRSAFASDPETSLFQAKFVVRSERFTDVALVRNTWKYHATTVHARLRTFRDEGIAFVIGIDVFDHSCDGYGYERTHVTGHVPDELREALTPDGVRELRDGDAAVHELVRAAFDGVTRVRPLAESLADFLPDDLVACVCRHARAARADPGGIDASWTLRPFKVLYARSTFWTKKPEYRIVAFDVDEEGDWAALEEDDGGDE